MAEKITPITGAPKRQLTTRAKVPRGESEFVGFRCAISRIRKMDEIVASRFYSEIKTRSDILQDAVVMWIDQYYEDNPTAPGKGDWDLTRMEIARAVRDSRLEQAERVARRAQDEDDRKTMLKTLPNLHRLRMQFEAEDASPTEMKRLRHLITQLEAKMTDAPT
jgi:hypothetical protein